MARDSSIYARRAGLTLLKGDAELAAIVGDRVYPPQRPSEPQWPFVGWGVPIIAPFEAVCLDGNDIDLAVHAYAATEGYAETVTFSDGSTFDNGAGLESGLTFSGEETATRIAERVAAVLVDAGEIDLTAYGCPYDAVAHFTWQQTQVIQDGAEADAFHAIATFRLVVVS